MDTTYWKLALVGSTREVVVILDTNTIQLEKRVHWRTPGPFNTYIVPFGQLNIAKNTGERPCPIIHNGHNGPKRKNESSVQPVGLLTHTKKGIGLAVCLYCSIWQLTIAKDARERSRPIVGPLWTYIVPYACSEGAATLGQT